MFDDFRHERNVLVALTRQFLRRVFDIRRGEEQRVALMLLYIFLVVSTLLIVKPVSSAQFLDEFGAEELPYAFVLVSILAAVTVTLYTRQIRLISYDRLIVRTLYLCIASLALFWALTYFDLALRPSLYAFYVWTALYAVIVTSQFWILANAVFNARQARRLFGVIGAGAIGGGIFGGYLTTILAPVVGGSHLLLLCMLFLLICVKITRVVTAQAGDRFSVVPDTEAADSNPIRLLLSSRHLAYLAAIVGISVLVAKLIEYQFSAIASEQIADADELTAFFGFWLSTVNIVSLLIQLFLTARIVSRFGVAVSLLFLPCAILIATLGVLFYPLLITAVLLKMSDGSLKQSINKAGMELLALPIPNEIKRQAKSLIDVLVDSLATGLGGLLLIVLTLSLSLSLRSISLVTIALIGVWIYLVVRVRREYVHSFRLKIESETPATEPALAESGNRVFEGIAALLGDSDPAQVRKGLAMIADLRNPQLLPALERLITHADPAIQSEALRQLYYYPASKQFEQVRKLVRSPSAALKTQAIHYLFQHSPDTRRDLLQMYLGDEDYLLRGAALLCAARESRDNDDYKSYFQLADRIERKLEQVDEISDPARRRYIKCTCAEAIGAARLRELYGRLLTMLNERDADVVRAALLAMGQTEDEIFISAILRYLPRGRYRRTAGEALRSYGPEIVDLLALELAISDASPALRVVLPEVIASFAVQRSATLLLRQLDEPDPRVRNAVIAALHRLRRHHAHLSFDDKPIVRRLLGESELYLQTLAALRAEPVRGDAQAQHRPEVTAAQAALRHALELRLDSNLQRIFRLLGLKYPPSDIDQVYLGICSDREELRSSAVEFLDNLLESSLKRAIIPIVESHMLGSLIDTAAQINAPPPPDAMACLSSLLLGADDQLRVKALALVAALKDPDYDSLLRSLVKHPHRSTRSWAQKALTGLSANPIEKSP